jgi:hypothetical protein
VIEKKDNQSLWLGGRDSNPDTQIQSSFEAQADQQNQSLSTVKREQLRQNPQYSRNENCPNFESRENDNLDDRAALNDAIPTPRLYVALNDFDFEEDTLP